MDYYWPLKKFNFESCENGAFALGSQAGKTNKQKQNRTTQMCDRARHLPWPGTSAPIQHRTVHSPGTEAKGYELFGLQHLTK